MPVQCPRCLALSRDGAQYCDKCGANLRRPEPVIRADPSDSVACPKCGAVNSKTARFCSTCRIPLATVGRESSPKRRLVPSLPLLLLLVTLLLVVALASSGAEGGALAVGIVGCLAALVAWRRKPPAYYYGFVLNLTPQDAELVDSRNNKSLRVWQFRLQRTDDAFREVLRDSRGDQLPPLSVEIRADRIAGTLSDGDKVGIEGRLNRSRMLFALFVRNYSTESDLAITRPRRGPGV
jgi:hypothetical protein